MPSSRFRIIALLLLGVILVGFSVTIAHAQGSGELSTSNVRAKRAFENAIQQLNLRNYRAAESEFMEAVRLDPKFIEAYIILGEMFQSANEHEKAIAAFANAIEINPEFFPNIVYYLAFSQYSTGLYAEAFENSNRFTAKQGISDEMRTKANDLIRRAEFAISAVANPVDFEPINLGANVNTEHDEYAPILTADEQTLIFTRKMPRTSMEYRHFGMDQEDFYVSKKINGLWSEAENPGLPLNTPRNEGAQSISADGMHLYFTACNRPGGFGSCDIYYSYRIGQSWSVPVNIGHPVNTGAWDSQPSIAPDGRSLYFVSNRMGSGGNMDIWKTFRLADGGWSEPQRLGPEINTAGREMSPYIHLDNRTLFFASNGHLGLGNMDLFYSVRQPDGRYSEPINLGFPINTHVDEISLVVAASGIGAYFASEKAGGMGGSDLYYFKLDVSARPNQVTYMKGIVFDIYSKDRLRADFELIDLVSGETLVRSASDAITGEFLVPIPVGRNLGLNVAREGYLFFSENFSYTDKRSGVDPHLYDIPLQPIKVGETAVLRNIFFHTGSHELLPESINELDKLFRLLQQNPEMKIEVSGHTDNVGSFEANLTLSRNRALSVYNFLTQRGIDPARLAYSGYADTRPIATNDTAEGRAKNRRTEFKILSYSN